MPVAKPSLRARSTRQHICFLSQTMSDIEITCDVNVVDLLTNEPSCIFCSNINICNDHKALWEIFHAVDTVTGPLHRDLMKNVFLHTIIIMNLIVIDIASVSRPPLRLFGADGSGTRETTKHLSSFLPFGHLPAQTHHCCVCIRTHKPEDQSRATQRASRQRPQWPFRSSSNILVTSADRTAHRT